MAKPGDVIDVPELGVRVVFLATSESTDGAYTEVDVIGNPKGFITVGHVHVGVTEHHTVLEGTMRVKLHGRTHVLKPGEEITIPPDTPHTQQPGSKEKGRIRIRLTPSARSDEFFERLAQLDYNRFGFPKPRSGAKFVRELGEAGHAARPSLKTQQRLAALLDDEYTFVDEWDVAAPREAVFAAIADARTYPEWWRPVYLDVDADGPAELGKESRQHFKGRLPYHLHTRSRVVALDAPRTVTADVDGDLRGRGTWTLTPTHKLVTGQRYALHLPVAGAIQDLAQNGAIVVGSAVRTTTIADDRSVAWSWPSGWTKSSSSNALGGTFEHATTGHGVSIALAGSSISVYGCKGPSYGSLVVRVDGVKKATVSEHQSFTKCGVLVWDGVISTSAQHTLNLTTVGTGTIDQVRVA